MTNDENTQSDGYTVEELAEQQGIKLDEKEKEIAKQEATFQDMALERVNKTLDNTSEEGAKKATSDLKLFGLPDTWKCISKASSTSEGWMKSTKAMHIQNRGCLIQVSTQQGDNVAEALHFVPGVSVAPIDPNDKTKGYKLV